VFLSLQDFENWYQCLGAKDSKAGVVTKRLGNIFCLQLTISPELPYPVVFINQWH